MPRDSTPAKKMGETRDTLRVYVALAMGTGTLERAREMEPRIDPSQIELEEVATGLHPLEPDSSRPPRPPSRILARVLEELSQYVRADIAARALDAALEELGVAPDEAHSLDVREAFGGPLPRLLNGAVTASDLEFVLENLERALTDAHAPAIGRPSSFDTEPDARRTSEIEPRALAEFDVDVDLSFDDLD